MEPAGNLCFRVFLKDRASFPTILGTHPPSRVRNGGRQTGLSASLVFNPTLQGTACVGVKNKTHAVIAALKVNSLGLFCL